jgi:hypothetical protein
MLGSPPSSVPFCASWDGTLFANNERGPDSKNQVSNNCAAWAARPPPKTRRTGTGAEVGNVRNREMQRPLFPGWSANRNRLITTPPACRFQIAAMPAECPAFPISHFLTATVLYCIAASENENVESSNPYLWNRIESAGFFGRTAHAWVEGLA